MIVALKVHLHRPPEDRHLKHLRDRLPEQAELTCGDDAPADTRILVSGRPPPEMLEACRELRALIIPFAGVPPETRERLRGYPDVSVHNLHHNAAPTAEMAMTLMLAAAKRILPADREFRRHDWTFRYTLTDSITLAGRHALVAGYGHVGRRIAEACRGLGMRWSAVRRRGSDGEPDVHGPGDLRRLLPEAHVLFLTVPLTDETRGMIGREELALLPAGAVLVNMARGEVVDEEALYEALREKRLGAAGLDVWYSYPKSRDRAKDTPPSRLPFHELDNVVMSPHRAGDPGTDDVERLRMVGVAELLREAAGGRGIPNRVDLDAGY